LVLGHKQEGLVACHTAPACKHDGARVAFQTWDVLPFPSWLSRAQRPGALVTECPHYCIAALLPHDQVLLVWSHMLNIAPNVTSNLDCGMITPCIDRLDSTHAAMTQAAVHRMLGFCSLRYLRSPHLACYLWSDILPASCLLHFLLCINCVVTVALCCYASYLVCPCAIAMAVMCLDA
jgi:hypothetical protein